MNNELPEGWVRTTVGIIAEDISYGFTAKASASPIGPRLLRITDIQDDAVNWESVPFCKIPQERLRDFSLHSGDIVFARTGATTGKSFLIDACPEAVFASYLIRVRPSTGVLPGFIAHFFKSATYWSQIADNISGSAQPNCNAAKLSSITIPVPPLAEQRRILAMLEALFARVSSCQTRLNKVPLLLKRFRQSILTSACNGNLTRDWRAKHNESADWPIHRLSELGEVTGGITKNATRQQLDIQVPYLRVANVYENRLELDEVLQIGVTKQEFARTRLSKGDLLFVEGNGSIDQIGRVALWDGSIPRCVHQNHLIKFRAGKEVIPGYVLLQMMAPTGRSQLIEKSTSSAGLNTLSISKISDVNLPAPNLAEQEEIVRRVEALFSLVNRIETRYLKAKAHVDRLTSALLAKAFRGELVDQDPSDEPAAVLLDRISAVRKRDSMPTVARQENRSSEGNARYRKVLAVPLKRRGR